MVGPLHRSRRKGDGGRVGIVVAKEHYIAGSWALIDSMQDNRDLEAYEISPSDYL